jgi:hypothetical protein
MFSAPGSCRVAQLYAANLNPTAFSLLGRSIHHRCAADGRRGEGNGSGFGPCFRLKIGGVPTAGVFTGFTCGTRLVAAFSTVTADATRRTSRPATPATLPKQTAANQTPNPYPALRFSTCVSSTTLIESFKNAPPGFLKEPSPAFVTTFAFERSIAAPLPIRDSVFNLDTMPWSTPFASVRARPGSLSRI